MTILFKCPSITQTCLRVTQVWNGHDSYFRNVAPVKKNKNRWLVHFIKYTL